MIFTKDKKLSESDKKLVNNFLENLINKSRKFCQSTVEKNGFVFLDSWDNKMGFVKERGEDELILGLQFDDSIDSKCYDYQLIIKKPGEHWKNSQLLDYKFVRNAGIILSMASFALIRLYSYMPVEPFFDTFSC